jgi:hypothetical protein
VSEHQSKITRQKQATQSLSNPNLGSDTTGNHRITPITASSQPLSEVQAKPQEENPSTNSQETEASQPTCYGHDISRISLRPTQRIFASGMEIFNQQNEVVIPPIPKGGGEPLQPEDRAVFEQSMELPLNRVRIHTSDEADNAARQMGAEAFTLGSDIYFANGFYAPGTPLGDRILGHELTHVKQNSDRKILSSSDDDAISKPTDPLEQEAYAQENIIANDVRKLRGDETSPAPIPSSNPPTSLPEKTGSEKNLASPSSSGQDNEEEKLIPQLPEAPSPFAVTNIEQQQSITPPASPTLIPAPNDYAGSATTVEPLKPNQAVIENTATTQQTNISTNQMEVQTPPTMTSATLPVADAVTQQLPQQLEVATETPTEPANLGVDIPLALEETSNDTDTALDTPDDVNLNEDGTAVAITQADVITQESQAMAQEVALHGIKTLDSITIQISELAASIQIKAEQARSEVVSAYTTQQEAVQAKVAETVAAIGTSQKQNHTAISNFADAEKQRFYTTKQTQREGAVAFIQEQKQQTIAAGDTQAQRALNQSEEKATSILAEAASVKTNGEPPSAEAQQKALQKIAENTAQKCRQTGNDLAQRVRSEATQQAGRYDELLQNYLQQLDTTGINIESSLSQFIDAARSRTDTIAQQATTAAQEMGNQSVATLETEKNNALTQIQTWVEQTSSVTQQLGSQLQEPFTNQISSLQESLINYGANAAAQLRTMERPEPSQVEAATAQMRQNMQEAYNGAIAALSEYSNNTQTELAGQSENLNSQLSELVSERITSAQQIGSQMVQALLEGAQNATTGMESATVSFQEKLTNSVNQAIADLTNVDQQFRSQVETTHKEAISSLSQLVDDGLKSEDNLIADARQEMSTAVGQIAGKYEQLKTEAENRSAAEGNTPATRIHRGIWGSITSFFGNLVDKVKKWFADTFGEFWGGLLFGILAGLVIVAVGALAMAGLGALLVAIGVSAKVAAIVVVVVGLVIAIPLGIYNRFQEFYADNPGQNAGFWRGLGLVTLGILDLTGIPFIIEGLVGQRAFGKELKGFERWERLGMGLVFLGGFLVAAKNLLRGKPKPDVKEPSGRRFVGEPGSGKEAPGGGCFVAGTKVLTPRGERTIESLITGNEVWSLTPSSKLKRTQYVDCTYIRNVTVVLDIQIGEVIITCSPEHPFWVFQQGWIRAKELLVGTTLFSLHKGNVIIENIQVRTGTFTVYNIEVNGLHNYCVSPLGILVHNKPMRWNLQDRAAAFKPKVNELLERLGSLPEDAPNKPELLRQVQGSEPEASRLSRLAEKSKSPEALEPSRDAIESMEERLTRLEEAIDTASLPSRAQSLPHKVSQLRKRVEKLPYSQDKNDMLDSLRKLEKDAEGIRDIAKDYPNEIDSLAGEIETVESELRNIESKIQELSPETPPEGEYIPRPHLSHPRKYLPTGGDRPYVPPRRAGNPEVVTWPEGGGFEDTYGNKWEWAKDPHAGPHWDVQHPNGTHTNVYPDGIVHQGKDKF